MSDYDELLSILREVQLGYRYHTDEHKYGTVEYWTELPEDKEGDCEDHALACRRICRERGLKSRLVMCTLNGAGHLVLECKGWILDNNYRKPMKAKDLPYKWLMISGVEPNSPWRLIKKVKK